MEDRLRNPLQFLDEPFLKNEAGLRGRFLNCLFQVSNSIERNTCRIGHNCPKVSHRTPSNFDNSCQTSTSFPTLLPLKRLPINCVSLKKKKKKEKEKKTILHYVLKVIWKNSRRNPKNLPIWHLPFCSRSVTRLGNAALSWHPCLDGCIISDDFSIGSWSSDTPISCDWYKKWRRRIVSSWWVNCNGI